MAWLCLMAPAFKVMKASMHALKTLFGALKQKRKTMSLLMAINLTIDDFHYISTMQSMLALGNES